ncbi:hypothetical protein TNCV_399531 [Trichonephila clavipes]|nr:hypothetical protein TNCV_399531 [Trichonephila clavipes]
MVVTLGRASNLEDIDGNGDRSTDVEKNELGVGWVGGEIVVGGQTTFVIVGSVYGGLGSLVAKVTHVIPHSSMVSCRQKKTPFLFYSKKN